MNRRKSKSRSVSRSISKNTFASRQSDVKASTQTFYRHTWKRLEEYFPGRTLNSITASDAKHFRLWLQDSNKRDKPEEGGAEYVFPGIRADTNLRTQLEKLINRAGVKQWPKIWQNLRASGATDFARSLPSHVAAEICGHTEQIAQEHYWTVTDNDLDSAIEMLSPEIDKKLAQKLAQIVVSKGPEASLPVSATENLQTKKPLVSQGVDEVFQLMSSLGLFQEVGGIGLE